MALADDLDELNPTFRTFADWLASEPEEGPRVVDMLRDPTIGIDALIRVLRRNGIPCSKTTVRSYRDGTL